MGFCHFPVPLAIVHATRSLPAGRHTHARRNEGRQQSLRQWRGACQPCGLVIVGLHMGFGYV